VSFWPSGVQAASGAFSHRASSGLGQAIGIAWRLAAFLAWGVRALCFAERPPAMRNSGYN